MIIKNTKVNNLEVYIHDTRKNMGIQVAKDFATYLKALQTKKKEVNIIFAAAPSQLDFLEALKAEERIDWQNVNVFHMDEYIGISIDQEQSFARFVKEKVAIPFKVGGFYPLNGTADNVEEECLRYATLLKENKIDIVCLGIGENGHLAFNDPGVADFWDTKDVKIVQLDEVCRMQQVNDKCFADLNSVPKYAMTLTIPTLMRADAMFCTVPSTNKAVAVKKTLQEDVNCLCPASILRIHKNAKLYCDKDSGQFIL